MNFDPVLLAPRRDQMVAQSFWRNETILDALARTLATRPSSTAVVAYRADRDNVERVTYQSLDDRSEVVAQNLVRLGIQPGDVVSFQLPNWPEFVLLALACAKVGAVANPLMHIFRERELRFMLAFGESKLFVVPSQYRGFDYPSMARSVCAELDSPPQIVVVDGVGDDSFEAQLTTPVSTPTSLRAIGADDVLLLMYTSGTTGEPKGVMHTSNTLFSNVYSFIERLELRPSDVVLGASPMAHLTGYGYLAMMPLLLGATAVLQDVWDARRALETIVPTEGVTFSMASSPFVADMCDAAISGAPVSATFDKFCCAGAPIPPILIERARNELGMSVCSAWGMTENGAVTITEPQRAAEKSGVSDGRPVPGMEVRVVGVNGELLAPGSTGALHVRGPSLFGGYLKRPEMNNTDADGWFDTGDLAFIDSEGYIRIDGRSKDLIIRGGENIPVVEVENVLYQHPSVAAVAIVGYPDDRLGERACAYVTLKPGTSLSFDDMCTYLSDEQVAKQYHPERLELVEDMPRTASGKIQKFVLRQRS